MKPSMQHQGEVERLRTTESGRRGEKYGGKTEGYSVLIICWGGKREI